MDFWKEFHGPNAAYILELYERYRRDPEAVDPATRSFFGQWKPPLDGVSGDGAAPAPAGLASVGLGPAQPDSAARDSAQAASAEAASAEAIMGAVNLAQAIRAFGHLAAQVDPLGRPPPGDPALDPEAHGVDDAALGRLPASLIGGPIAARTQNAAEAIRELRAVYSHHTGYDFDHIRVPEEREWLRHAAESCRFRAPEDPLNPAALLERLSQVEAFESFLHRIFPGKTRFSIEGLDMMVPVLDEIVGDAAEAGIYNILIGMAHRGRLNVMAHLLNKPYEQILAEFKDPVRGRKHEDDLGWTGDVKYHLGAQRAEAGGPRVDLMVTLAPNPSHLEAVNPVVEGMARAAGTRVDSAGPARFDPSVTLPILIHGDLAFAGQGVVAETLNFHRLPGFTTGGTVHIIANNQLGFTTLPQEGYSTLYASDLAKGFKIPIVHVNADDPEACVEAARLAIAYRQHFHKDFLIDLIGYRRYGHNEGDEPAFTQPLMYAAIESHPTVRALWARTLAERGVIAAGRADEMLQQRMEALQRVLEGLRPEETLVEPQPEPPPRGAARRVKTAVPLKRLRALYEAMLQTPADFHLHPKLARAMDRRRRALEDDSAGRAAVDWAAAEDLAFASILEDGIAIRLTGEDVERGTFSQRHAVFHDVENGEPFIPLQALPQAQAAFEVRNSPLSENAAIGFEYGYNVQAPDRLVIWEGQYGDFINGAQVVIDEFLVSARAKWGQTPSLVLLLPHGYEGQGPDHSSGRLERFLGLAAEYNLRIANCTTAAQYFHLLRRQALLLKTDPLPLIVMTPKSLLRNPAVASPLRDLAEGGWQPVIDDETVREAPEAVRRLILCSGKIYVDLAASEGRKKAKAVAIARVEQLYPFPADEVRAALESYPKLAEVAWVQEEPENMGAWEFVRTRLEKVIGGRWPLHQISRSRNASPAEGSSARHALNQKRLIERAFDLKNKT